MKTFKTYRDALAWAWQHASAFCHFHHVWRVTKVRDGFAVGIYSRNTGALDDWAH